MAMGSLLLFLIERYDKPAWKKVGKTVSHLEGRHTPTKVRVSRMTAGKLRNIRMNQRLLPALVKL